MLNHNIKGTNITVTPELRTYAEKKLASTEKFLNGDSTAHADIELEYAEVRNGGKYRAEFNLSAGGGLYRAEEWGSTMHEAVDLAMDQLVKELRRTKNKHLRHVRHGAVKFKEFMRGFRERF